jgi:DNA-binding NarL/FixJ family response regulator
MAITVLIVDDHASFRAWARMMLEAEGYDVVGEAEDARSALAAAAELAPEVVLLDVHLPDGSGLEIAHEFGSDAAVILVSSRDAADFGSRIARSGARGFISKTDLSAVSMQRLLAEA